MQPDSQCAVSPVAGRCYGKLKFQPIAKIILPLRFAERRVAFFTAPLQAACAGYEQAFVSPLLENHFQLLYLI
jgi:hypothetical protein